MTNGQAEKPAVKWYLKPVTILVWILVLGPFAIPLVIASPAFKTWQKIAISIALIMLTVWLMKATIDIYQGLLSKLQSL